MLEILSKQNLLCGEVRIIKDAITKMVGQDDILHKKENIKLITRHYVNGKKIYSETCEELDKMEAALEDSSFLQEVGNHLSTLGGMDLKQVTRNILFELISNKVASQYSWVGREKMPFKDMNVTKLVKAVVRSHVLDLKDSDVDDIIARWLVQAPLRCKRDRVKLSKKKNQNTKPVNPDVLRESEEKDDS